MGSKLVIAAVLLGTAATVAGPLAAAEPEEPISDSLAVAPSGKVTRYGIFRNQGTGWVQDDAQSSTGKVIRGATLEFDQETDRVPLVKGTTFGYRYWLKLAPDEERPELTRVLIHPEMALPDGSTVTRSERTFTKSATHGIVTAIDAYALSEQYELVAGDWIFQILWDGKVLAEQRFTTCQPTGADDPDH